MATETLVIYRTADAAAPGWEKRKLLPSGGLVDILAEESDYSGRIPVVGERVREYENLEDPGNGVTHGKDGAWVVSEVQKFTSFDTDTRIVICLCEYQPVEAEWQELNRGTPASELTEISV